MVVMRPLAIPKVSWSTLATGARQLVVHAGGVRDDVVLARVVGLEVDAASQRHVRVLGRGADEDLPGPAAEVLASRIAVDEQAGRLDDDVGPELLPGDLARVLLGDDLHLVAGDDQRALARLDLAREAAVHRVVAEEVSQGLGVGQVIDEDQIERLLVRHQRADEPAADATEPVDTDAYLRHVQISSRLNGRDAGTLDQLGAAG
jgi:hypothetical protein